LKRNKFLGSWFECVFVDAIEQAEFAEFAEFAELDAKTFG